eukprot:12055064-Prorocentrum_lima.AAC.1
MSMSPLAPVRRPARGGRSHCCVKSSARSGGSGVLADPAVRWRRHWICFAGGEEGRKEREDLEVEDLEEVLRSEGAAKRAKEVAA